MGWNYRLVRHTASKEGVDFTYYQLHEAYYADDKAGPGGNPTAITLGPASLMSATEPEMRTMLKRMLESLDKPTVNFKDMEKSLKNSKEPVDSLIER